MHHAPAGPPPAARLGALVRRSRLLPLTAAGLVVVGIVLAGPPSAGGLATGTAAYTSPSEDGRELVPATGDGWTQDGRAPATGDGWTQDGRAPARTDEGPAADPAPRSPDAATASRGTAPSDTAPSDTAPSSTAPSSTAPSDTAQSSTGSSHGAGTAESPVNDPHSSPATVSSAGTPSTSARVERTGKRAPSSSSSPSSSVPAPAPGTVVADGGAEQALAAVDAARTAAGCEALTVDAGLSQAATAHSTAMRDETALLPPPGTGAVAGDSTDPAAAAAGWLADARRTLTDCALATAGVGVVDGWWTLLLA